MNGLGLVTQAEGEIRLRSVGSSRCTKTDRVSLSSGDRISCVSRVCLKESCTNESVHERDHFSHVHVSTLKRVTGFTANIFVFHNTVARDTHVVFDASRNTAAAAVSSVSQTDLHLGQLH